MRDSNKEKTSAAVYMMANERRDCIYVGVTSRLWPRVAEHKAGSSPGFTGRYALAALVWYEFHDSMEAAILRESRLKLLGREGKLALVSQSNPAWLDLHEGAEQGFIGQKAQYPAQAVSA